MGQQIKLGEDDEAWRTESRRRAQPALGRHGRGRQLSRQHEGVYLIADAGASSATPYIVDANRTQDRDDVDVGGPGFDPRHRSAAPHLLRMRSLNEHFAMRAVFYEIFGTLFTAFGNGGTAEMATIGLYGVMVVLGQQPSRGNRRPDGAQVRTEPGGAGADSQARARYMWRSGWSVGQWVSRACSRRVCGRSLFAN